MRSIYERSNFGGLFATRYAIRGRGLAAVRCTDVVRVLDRTEDVARRTPLGLLLYDFGMGQNLAPTIEQIISNLMNRIVVGKAHLVVAKGLADSDPAVLAAAKVFFAMTIDAHLYAAQMIAAGLHDSTRGAVTVQTLRKRAMEATCIAKHGSDDEVKAAISDSEKTLSELSKRLKALEKRRNAWLAHTDPRTITDPTRVAAAAAVNIADLEAVFGRTGEIVNEFSRLYRNITGVLDVLDQTDFETVIQFVSAAKCEQVRLYEAEFGAPAPFPRPKDCL